jgi:hypothetical protein
MIAFAQQMLSEADVEPPTSSADDEDSMRRVRAAVKNIPKSSPAFEVEAELRRILIGEFDEIQRSNSQPNRPAFLDLTSRLLSLCRLRCLRMVVLGDHLSEMRNAAWKLWHESLEQNEDRDPDEYPLPDDERSFNASKFDILLRLGPAAAKMGQWEAVELFARHLMVSKKLSSWKEPADAIENIVDWARCAWPLRNGEVQTIRQLCKNEWNTLLPMAPATVAMVRTVMEVAPCPGNQSPKKPAGKKRIGLLRLFQRLSAQRDFWPTLGEVELPGRWLTDAKEHTDPKAIIGISNNTVVPVLKRMADLDILVKIGDPIPVAHQCTRYQLALVTSDDPTVDEVIVPGAESLLSKKPDHAIESELKALVNPEELRRIAGEKKAKKRRLHTDSGRSRHSA